MPKAKDREERKEASCIGSQGIEKASMTAGGFNLGADRRRRGIGSYLWFDDETQPSPEPRLPSSLESGILQGKIEYTTHGNTHNDATGWMDPSLLSAKRTGPLQQVICNDSLIICTSQVVCC
jgi:hypothetical protein